MIAFTAQHEQQMASMRRQLQQCQLANGGGPPTPIIDVCSRVSPGGRGGLGGEQRQSRGPMSDGPEGITKTKKYYDKCDNVC